MWPPRGFCDAAVHTTATARAYLGVNPAGIDPRASKSTGIDRTSLPKLYIHLFVSYRQRPWTKTRPLPNPATSHPTTGHRNDGIIVSGAGAARRGGGTAAAGGGWGRGVVVRAESDRQQAPPEPGQGGAAVVGGERAGVDGLQVRCGGWRDCGLRSVCVVTYMHSISQSRHLTFKHAYVHAQRLCVLRA